MSENRIAAVSDMMRQANISTPDILDRWESVAGLDEFQQVAEGIAALDTGDAQLVGNRFVHFTASQFNDPGQRLVHVLHLETQVPDTVIIGVQ